MLACHLQAQLPPATTAKIDAIAAQVLADTGAPSASIAVVKDGKIAYLQAYGKARLEPATAARPEMRYSIGSVSKQFMAGAILLLVQDGKLSLDDRVGRYLPDLTRANEITIRQLLSHTSGYQDYYPLDYVAPFMQKPVTAEGILDIWAKKPLDFDPGTRWQYSNTNFRRGGQHCGEGFRDAADGVSGSPHSRPAGDDQRDRSGGEIDGAVRRCRLHALCPGTSAPRAARGPRLAVRGGRAGDDGARSGIVGYFFDRAHLLKPASLDMMITPARLKNGSPTDYGLGIGVRDAGGHPRLSHGGAVSGFVSENTVWPDARTAVVVFSNMDGSNATNAITDQIAPLLLAEVQDPRAAEELEQARRIFSDLQQGKIDRRLLTSDADAYFTAQVLSDAAESLKPLGTPENFRQLSVELRGGMTYRHFEIRFKEKALHLSTFTTPDGKLAQYLIQ